MSLKKLTDITYHVQINSPDHLSQICCQAIILWTGKHPRYESVCVVNAAALNRRDRGNYQLANEINCCYGNSLPIGFTLRGLGPQGNANEVKNLIISV